jgi:hypothetical protein
VGVLESLRQGFAAARNHDQMHMIRHETVAQQREAVKLRVLPQQLKVGDTVGVVGQNYLPGVPPLRNMMGNVNHDDAREAGHSQKISERTRTWQDSQQFLDRGNRLHSHIGLEKMGTVPSVPGLSSWEVIQNRGERYRRDAHSDGRQDRNQQQLRKHEAQIDFWADHWLATRKGGDFVIGRGTSLWLTGFSSSGLIVWFLLRGRSRARQYNRVAGELGFTYLGNALPETLNLSKASFWNSWDMATNVIAGNFKGVETAVLHFHANHGEVGYKQTTVAMKSSAPVVELSSLWQSSGIRAERIGEWIVMFREKETLATAQIPGFLDDCRSLVQYFEDRQGNPGANPGTDGTDPISRKSM